MSALTAVEKWEYLLRGALRDLPAPTPEYEFMEGRGFKADWAWTSPRRVIVEIDGGQHKADGGRHNQDSDREKLNLAAALGFTVIRLTPGLLQDLTWVAQLVRAALLGTDPPLTCRVVQEQARQRRERGKRRKAAALVETAGGTPLELYRNYSLRNNRGR